MKNKLMQIVLLASLTSLLGGCYQSTDENSGSKYNPYSKNYDAPIVTKPDSSNFIDDTVLHSDGSMSIVTGNAIIHNP